MRLKPTTLVVFLALLSLVLPGQSSNPPVTIRVDATHPGATISNGDGRFRKLTREGLRIQTRARGQVRFSFGSHGNRLILCRWPQAVI